MTIRVRPITREESETLGRWQRSDDIVRYRRARILRLSEAKWKCPVIAQALGLHEETVREVITAFNEGGIPAITPRPRSGGRPPSYTEEVAQEVFIKLYQSGYKIRGESKLSTWLYRVAVNKSLNFLRKKNKDQVLLLNSYQVNSGTGESGSPDSDMIAADHRNALHSAIDSLPENQRVAFVLSRYDELSYLKIAEVMKLSVSAVESLLFRAKRNLQVKLIHYYKKNLE